MSLFVPDFIFDNFYSITPEFLKENNISAIVSDIDNTLVTYDDEKPTLRVLSWLESLASADIKISFVSNNSHERVRIFNEALGFFAVGKSKKPFKKNILHAVEYMNVPRENVCMLGDQIFTDVLAGQNAGLKTILVPPINDKRDVLTRFKRFLEKPIIKKYYKLKREEQK
jgi:HAD superfamily phosphatase (TIGR01668 family)